MAFQIKRERPGTTSPLKERLKDRPAMLRLSMLWGSRWLILRGGVGLLGAVLFIHLPHMRNHPIALLPQAELGASLAALGYFVSKAVDDPRRQHLAVDALALYLMASIIGFFINISRVQEILNWEWAGLFGNILFCAMLLLYRTRESELRGSPDAPREAKEAAKDLIRSLKEVIDGRKRPPLAPKAPEPSQEPETKL